LRMIAGLIRPNKGKVLIQNKEMHKDIDFPESIGVVIETPDFWKDYTGIQVLKVLADIKKIITIKEMNNALNRVGLDPKDKRTIRKYSLGMKQRLGIAQAIMEAPDILLLDEPTNALDKSGMKIVEDIIKEEANRGATVIIASHNINDLNLCHELIEIENGRVV
ncbi:MAG: ATP-binding cassette domain-containing protein, partial [Clostridiaceae bacterium]